MFYKGILKSYDATEKVGIIHLPDNEIDLHFSVDDFPNPTLEPQIGERVKCLIEEKDFKHVAKFIVRLDHKNARTEKPRNNIFYSEEEDLEALKKAQEEKEQELAENAELLKNDPSIPQEFLENKKKLEKEKKLINKRKSEKKKLGIKKNPETTQTQQNDATSDNAKRPFISTNKLISSTSISTAQKAEVSQNVKSIESLSTQNSKPAEPILQTKDNSVISNEHLDSTEPISTDAALEAVQSVDSTATELNNRVDPSNSNENATVVLLKEEDEIKIPQTAKLSSLTQPVDIDIEGTLDLSHPTEIKPILTEKPTNPLITPSSEVSHLSHAKTIIPLSSDPFEQLQQELGSRHTTSIPEHSRMSMTAQQTSSTHLDDSMNGYTPQQNEENPLQKVKTQLTYNTHKGKTNKRVELNFNPWILIGAIALILLAGLGYLGFKKYQVHKQEQEAKARYYLLEQQKAIEDQRKKMAKLSDKPIIPEHRRKELLGETAQ